MQIEDVKRLDIRPGDVLVIRPAQHIGAAGRDRARERFREVIPDGVTVLILDPGDDLTVVRPDAEALRQVVRAEMAHEIVRSRAERGGGR